MITDALRDKRPKLSAREAAKRVGISETRWRQIVKGYQTISGTDVPVRGPAETVARMALVAGVTASQLADAGRQDAADELRVLAGKPKPEGPVGHDFAERIERILNNPAALKRAEDLLRAARIPEIEEEEDRRGRNAG